MSLKESILLPSWARVTALWGHSQALACLPRSELQRNPRRHSTQRQAAPLLGAATTDAVGKARDSVPHPHRCTWRLRCSPQKPGKGGSRSTISQSRERPHKGEQTSEWLQNGVAGMGFSRVLLAPKCSPHSPHQNWDSLCKTLPCMSENSLSLRGQGSHAVLIPTCDLEQLT